MSYFHEEVARGYDAPPCRIETEVPAPVMAKLLERIRRQWTILGEEEPYWGVLVDERFKSDTIDESALAAFHDSGLANALMIDTATRRGLPSRIGGTCVELGCGVGRITRHLAARFDKVVAIDISPGNLRLCEQYLASAGIGNVETRLLQNLDDLAHIGPFDWFYSVIVLQHNPPPIQRLVLETLLPQIRSGGGFVFQTVSDLPGYEFIAEQYLATDDPVMEIHSLPQRSIFKLIDQANLKLNAVRMDAMLAAYGSYTYEGYRP
jgi:2-polyprenyl-3-methyl-5-hydroxy-6-metoxy-1,4-benzoquinol methylase